MREAPGNVVPVAGCVMCTWVAERAHEEDPFFVADLGSSLLFMGDDRDGDRFRGYAVLVHKHHVREPHDLRLEEQTRHFSELMRAGQAVSEAFAPQKMNYASFGNEQPHLHWHVIPRYEWDPDFDAQPWRHEEGFRDSLIDPADGRRLALDVRRRMGSPPVARQHTKGE